MNNLFDMSMGQLTEFAVGDDLLASSFNQPIKAINRAMQVRVRSPHQVEYPTVPLSSQFEFVMLSALGTGVDVDTGVIIDILMVKRITFTPGSPGTVTIDDGPSFAALPWPGYGKEPFRALQMGGFNPPESAPVLGLFTVGDLLFVSLDLKWDVQTLSFGTRFNECLV